MLLDELDKKTNDIFYEKDIFNDVDIQCKKILESYKDAGLYTQYNRVIYQHKQKLIESLGFVKFTDIESVKLLTGQEYNSEEDIGRFNYEWFYIDGLDEVSTKWGASRKQFKRLNNIYKTNWWGNRIVQKSDVDWVINKGALNDLAVDIPYGIALKLAELKKKKVFNSFFVLAPEDAWIKRQYVDPILMGRIVCFNSNYNNTLEESDYFIAKW